MIGQAIQQKGLERLAFLLDSSIVDFDSIALRELKCQCQSSVPRLRAQGGTEQQRFPGLQNFFILENWVTVTDSQKAT